MVQIVGVNLNHPKCFWVQCGSKRESLEIWLSDNCEDFRECRLSGMPSTLEPWSALTVTFTVWRHRGKFIQRAQSFLTSTEILVERLGDFSKSIPCWFRATVDPHPGQTNQPLTLRHMLYKCTLYYVVLVLIWLASTLSVLRPAIELPLVRALSPNTWEDPGSSSVWFCLIFCALFQSGKRNFFLHVSKHSGCVQYSVSSGPQ